MTQFDEILRRGLMDANLAQYETVLQRANDMQPDFSPRYLRERTRMLEDPWEWFRRRSVRKRIDWRLIAIAAALLLLSACAYAVATGQFSQWFPRMGVDPEAPETSEEVLSRTGTIIGQSQTVGNTTATLNAAVWDGTSLWLSLVIESPNIPEEVREYIPLYTADCRLILRDDQWLEYERNRMKDHYAEMDMTPEQAEEDLRSRLDRGDRLDNLWLSGPDKREGNTLTFQINTGLFAGFFTETKQPELTLHLENIATCADGEGGSAVDENGYAQNLRSGEVFIEGPFDLAFTLEEPILPIEYEGASVEVTIGKVPLRFTNFHLSATEVLASGEVLAPVDRPVPGEEPDPNKLNLQDLALANLEGPWGLWTEDGNYVDLTSMGSGAGAGGAEGEFHVTMGRDYPYPIDPATVTAVNAGGIRVELSDLEVRKE